MLEETNNVLQHITPTIYSPSFLQDMIILDFVTTGDYLMYEEIIQSITPTEEQRKKILDFSDKLIDIITSKASENGIDVECRLVGSMAKKTSLIDKADMDIFITFPLTTPKEELKKYGLDLGRYCIEQIGADEEVRYASHPYITGLTDSFEIDFVPCYRIKDSSQLKSAVDRTILHTDYVQANLDDSMAKQVLLLKKFMTSINTYGANFKVGGFSGYLCELLIIKYGSFEKVIHVAGQNWHEGFSIDLENYGTANNFDAPLIVIDPTDKGRNVSAALSSQKFSEFIVACRNFMENPCMDYFKTRMVDVSGNDLKNEFLERNTKCYVLSFNVPDMPSDIIYPQITKTRKSFERVSGIYDFSVIQSSYFIRENTAHILLEYEFDCISNIKIHEGPLVKLRSNGDNFKNKYDGAFIFEDSWKAIINREYTNVVEMINGVITDKQKNLLKLGKNVKKEIEKEYSLTDIYSFIDNCKQDDFTDIYMHLHPTYRLER